MDSQDRMDRFRALVEATSDWVWEMDLEGRHTFSNDRLTEYLGYTADELLELDFFELFHPEDRQEVDTRLPALMANKEGWSNWVVRLRHKDGRYRHLNSNAVPKLDPAGNLVGYLGADSDITDSREAQLELERSESRFRQLAEQVNFVPWEADPATFDITYIGPQAELRSGYPLSQWQEPGFWLSQLYNANDGEKVLQELQRDIATRDNFRFEYRMVLPTGETIWLSTLINVVRENGLPILLRGVTIDITEQKRTEQEKDLLVRELDDRVKNTLAVVGAIANQSLASAGSMAEFTDTFGGRIQALERVYTMLFEQSHGSGIDPRTLCEEIFKTFSEAKRVSVGLADTDLRIPQHIVRPVAMALHELMTNARKYGALSRPEGRVTLSWREITPESGGGVLRIEWAEYGGPSVARPQTRGFGTTLIEESLPYELGARVRLDFPASGVICQISIPLRRHAIQPTTPSDRV